MMFQINSPELMEDKFMQSRAFNLNPSKTMASDQNFENYRKDYLVSADMRDFEPNEIDESLFRFNQGPYNPRPGQDYRMVDLNMMREDLQQ